MIFRPNKKYDIYVEPEVDELYKKMINEFPKVKEKIEDQTKKSNTYHHKRYMKIKGRMN